MIVFIALIRLGLSVGQFTVLICLLNASVQHMLTASAARVFGLRTLLTLALSTAVVCVGTATWLANLKPI